MHRLFSISFMCEIAEIGTVSEQTDGQAFYGDLLLERPSDYNSEFFFFIF